MFNYYVNSSHLRYFFKMAVMDNAPEEEDKQKGSHFFVVALGEDT